MAVATFQTEIKILIDKVIDEAKSNSIIVEIANRKYIQKIKLNIIKAMELYVIGKINKDNKDNFVEYLKSQKYLEDYKYTENDAVEKGYEYKAIEESMYEFYLRYTTNNKITENITKVSEI